MPNMMQNRMRAPAKSKRGIGGVLKELFTYSSKLKVPSLIAFLFAVAGAILTIIGPNLLSQITDLISDALGGGDRPGGHRPHRSDAPHDLWTQRRSHVCGALYHGHGDSRSVPGSAAGPVPEDQPGAHELLQQSVLRRYSQPCHQRCQHPAAGSGQQRRHSLSAAW